MSDLWLPLAIAGGVGMGAFLFVRRGRPEPMVFADEREERLTRRLAEMVGCSRSRALAFIQREIEIAPTQSDDTLLKRAAYHYRQELPEKACDMYRDRVPG